MPIGATAPGVTLGRYTNSVGEEHFPAQRVPSPGTANAGPAVGPIVISEIHYHPPDTAFNGIGYNDSDSEYVELQNITNAGSDASPSLLPSKVANRLIARVTGVRLHDYGCSLKAYRREVLEGFKLYGEMHRFIPAIAGG